MIYIQYERIKQKYRIAQDNYEELIREKEDLFNLTQPRAQQTDKERIAGGQTENSFDRYLIKQEQKNIDERLEAAKEIVDVRKEMLEQKRAELEASEDVMDRLYYLKYIKRLRNKEIYDVIDYSKAQSERYLRQIRSAIIRIFGQEN